MAALCSPAREWSLLRGCLSYADTVSHTPLRTPFLDPVPRIPDCGRKMQTESRGPGRLGGFRRTQVYSDLGGPLPLLEQNGRRRGGARGSHAGTSVSSAVAPSSARPGTARAPGRPDRQAQRRGSVALSAPRAALGTGAPGPEKPRRGAPFCARLLILLPGGEGAPRPARGSALHARGRRSPLYLAGQRRRPRPPRRLRPGPG